MSDSQLSRTLTSTMAELPETGLDATSPTPLYHQIFVLLREKIYRGDYKIDSYLPSEQEIVVSFGVSRITAKRALDEIAAAGLAVREQGRGTRVSIKPYGTSVRGGVEGLMHSLRAKGNSRVRLLAFAYVPAPKAIADKLGIPVGDEVQHATRVWYADAGPFNYLSTFVPAALGRKWSREDLKHKTLASLLEDSGVKIAGTEESITATLADEVTAGRLEVAVGSALLKITRTMFDERDKAVEHVTALYPPDRYQYTITLGRGRQPISAVHPLKKTEAR
jgi:GntR family transcriptional regulator